MEEEKTDIVAALGSPSKRVAASPYKRLMPGEELPIRDSPGGGDRRGAERLYYVPKAVKDEPMEDRERDPPGIAGKITQAQMLEIVRGQNALMTEVARLSNDQRNTEKSAAIVLSEINMMMEQLKERQMELNQRSIDMEQGMRTQTSNTQWLEQEPLRRDEEILRQTEQAFGRTEESFRQIPDLLQPGLSDHVRNIPWHDSGGGRDVSMGIPTMGLPPAGGGNPEMETAVRPEPVALAYVPINVSDPPKYQPDRYELYRKEVLWWEDIHFGAHDSQLVGMMAIKGEGLIMSFLVQFMEETRNSPQTRTIARLLHKLDVELAKSAHETSMAKISI